MYWFGFGFNAFGQILVSERDGKRDDSNVENYKCVIPISLVHVNECEGRATCQHVTQQLSASWSRRASLCLHEEGRLYLSGFAAEANDGYMKESHGCKDAWLSERYLTLGFKNKIECWNLEQKERSLMWSMEIKSPEEHGTPLRLPLIPGGYIAAKPPFHRTLSPRLKAVSLALGAEHAILLSATGTVYSWGSGSHGQLGHSGLACEKEPRPVEALWGVPINSVATGGWHSSCISAGGDLYVWGWNESGQLGLPSQVMRTKRVQGSVQGAAALSQDLGTAGGGEAHKGVFISIQAFPALLDLTESCEVSKVSCGSRHTAAVTTTGDLYTWGWGDYGQLGDGTTTSSDEPRRVEFFRQRGLRVVDVVCGAWNTFAAATEEGVARP